MAIRSEPPKNHPRILELYSKTNAAAGLLIPSMFCETQPQLVQTPVASEQPQPQEQHFTRSSVGRSVTVGNPGLQPDELDEELELLQDDEELLEEEEEELLPEEEEPLEEELLPEDEEPLEDELFQDEEEPLDDQELDDEDIEDCPTRAREKDKALHLTTLAITYPSFMDAPIFLRKNFRQ
jgi:hypothetical protein